jgi:hypothetical protein
MEYPIQIALPVRKAEDTCKKESSPRPKTLIQLLTLLRLEVWNIQPRRSTCVCFVVPPISNSLEFAGTLSSVKPPMELRLAGTSPSCSDRLVGRADLALPVREHRRPRGDDGQECRSAVAVSVWVRACA